MEIISNSDPALVSPPRKPYTKPKMEQVRLVLEEAVLGFGCKMAGTAGPYNGSCEDVNTNNCVLSGS